MVFTSAVFLFLFLPIVLGVYRFLPRAYANAFLLAASLLFYFYGEGAQVWILLLSVFMNYYAARLISGEYTWFPQTRLAKNLMLAACVVLNLGLLGWFKYANFFVQEILMSPGQWETIALPIGISFYTFQCLSYVMDVHAGTVKTSRSLVDFGCYVTCFPQLIAGPIVRYSDIEKELIERSVSTERFALGVERFLIGFCKKMLIANPLGRVSDTIYALPMDNLDAPHAWLAMTCYTLQIFYDFSGYSDMAIGLGHMLGFSFPENFNYPYISRSIQDFWRRWHMSLSSWLRDYLYIPLGGNRCSGARHIMNLWLVFLLCGLWHGAQWSFILWGGYHGLFLVLERTRFGRIIHASPRVVQHVYTLLVIYVGWVIFRADTMPHALAMLKAAMGLGVAVPYAFSITRFLTPDFLLTLAAGVFFSMPIAAHLRVIPDRFGAFVRSASTVALLPLFVLALTRLSADTYNPFLYFRF